MKLYQYVCAALAVSLVLCGCAKTGSSTVPETSAETSTETSADSTASEKVTDDTPEDAEETATPTMEYDIYREMDGIVFGFMSGVGAWETTLYVNPDGSFSGQFMDADMGVTDADYPNGTIYICSFTGRFSEPGALSEYAFQATVEELDFEEYVDEEKTQTEYIEDGTRYILSAPYGLSLNADMEFYRPDTPVSSLTEDCINWNPTWLFLDSLPETIGEYAIYNASDGYAFYPDSYATDAADASTGGSGV